MLEAAEGEWEEEGQHGSPEFVTGRGPTEDIIHYFTLMSSELHYLDIITKH